MAMTPVLWDFKKNKFVKMGGGGGSGNTVSSETIIDDGKTSGTVVTDPTASGGQVIQVNFSSTNTTIVDYTVEDIKFGMQSITVRSSINSTLSSDQNLALIRTYYINPINNSQTLLSTTYIKYSYYDGKINTYKDFGFITIFKGAVSEEAKMRILVQTAYNAGSNFKMNFDTFNIAPTFPAVTEMPTILS